MKFVGLAAAAALVLAACEKEAEQPVSSAPPPSTAQPTPPSTIDQSPYAPGSQEELEAQAGSRVYFGYDEYSLDAEAQSTLRKQADWMRKYPNKSVVIEGHCDERGTREYNLALGARRAEAAKRYLTSLGIEEGRISTISYGKERPEAVGSNEAAWAQNRRDVTVVQ
jgi:peptidoglycan-associated lipoprotein